MRLLVSVFLSINFVFNYDVVVTGVYSGTPEIGGLTTIQALELLRGCQGMNIVGGDVVEVLDCVVSRLLSAITCCLTDAALPVVTLHFFYTLCLCLILLFSF